MVRQKNRWLLVRFDFESDIAAECFPPPDHDGGPSAGTALKAAKKKQKRPDDASLVEAAERDLSEVTTTDIYRAIHESLSLSFGLIGAATTNIQVNLYDAKARLAIIKTTREKYPLVRTSITFVSRVRQRPVVATTVAVSGSPRTARAAAWKEVRGCFFDRDVAKIRGGDGGMCVGGGGWSKRARASMEKELRDLEERMEKIDSAC